MWIELRENLIVFCQKIEDFNAGKRSEKQKNKTIYQRSLAKERRFANDAMRAEAKQKKKHFRGNYNPYMDSYNQAMPHRYRSNKHQLRISVSGQA